MNNDQDSTQSMDDIPAVDNGQSEQDLLDAVLRNSPIMDEIEVPLPGKEETYDDPDESVEEDPDVTDEAVSEEEDEVEEAEVDAEDEDAGDEPATQDTDVFTADDLDLDAKVSVKVDGVEMDVSFGELLKGYQTDAHLSKKGRELGEAQKAADVERTEKLAELDKMSEVSNAILHRSRTSQG